MNKDWEPFKDDPEIGELIRQHDALEKKNHARQFPTNSGTAQMMLSRDEQKKLREDQKELATLKRTINEKIQSRRDSKHRDSKDDLRWWITTGISILALVISLIAIFRSGH